MRGGKGKKTGAARMGSLPSTTPWVVCRFADSCPLNLIPPGLFRELPTGIRPEIFTSSPWRSALQSGPPNRHDVLCLLEGNLLIRVVFFRHLTISGLVGRDFKIVETQFHLAGVSDCLGTSPQGPVAAPVD